MYQFSAVEKVLLAVLMAASAWGFWRRFGFVLQNILAAKADAGVSLRPLGPRIRDFFMEVALQAKVIRERPAAGLAHAFVFWGFCVFALVTAYHIASGFGFAFLSPNGGVARFYF